MEISIPLCESGSSAFRITHAAIAIAGMLAAFTESASRSRNDLLLEKKNQRTTATGAQKPAYLTIAAAAAAAPATNGRRGFRTIANKLSARQARKSGSLSTDRCTPLIAGVAKIAVTPPAAAHGPAASSSRMKRVVAVTNAAADITILALM